MRRLLLTALPLVAVLFWASGAPCQPMRGLALQTFEAPDLTVLYEEPLRPAAERVAALYPGLKAALERTFGWGVNFAPTVVVLKEEETFRAVVGTSLVMAVAIPERRLVVLDFSKMHREVGTLEVTVKHELCHLLLHEHIGSGNLPRWLDEGACQWASDGWGELVSTSERSELLKAAVAGRLYSFRALAEGFPAAEKGMALAYEQSRSMVDFMVREYGTGRFLRFLGELAGGADVDLAAQRAFAVTFDALEESWYTFVKGRYTWFRFVSGTFEDILFFLAALVALAGALGVVARRRARRRAMEEAGEEPPGEALEPKFHPPRRETLGRRRRGYDDDFFDDDPFDWR